MTSTIRNCTLRLRAIPAACLAVLLLAGCEKEPEANQAAAPPPAVIVAKAVRKDVTSALEFVGRIEAIDKVELRARVQGFLEKRLFDEGQDVKTGDPLFTIEKSQYQAQVDQAKANVASAQAAAVNTGIQLDRALELIKKGNIPQATVDDRKASDAMAKAQVLQAQAALNEAQINLGYTDIVAPVAGRIGLAKYTIGNLVGPDSGPLATIVSQDPIYVLFPVSQRAILELQKRAASDPDARKVVVRLRLSDGSLYPEPGEINFLGIQVSAGTDTVTIRAQLPNPKRMLVDGQFATVAV